MGHRVSKSALKKTAPDVDSNGINEKSRKELLRCLDNMDKQLELFMNELHDKRREKRSNKITPTYYDVNKNAIFDKDL
jgi:hypothetical protein